MTQELEDQLALLERLVDGLDRLDETTRVTVVLHHLGELDQDQVADVAGRAALGRSDRRLSEAAAALDLVPLDPACHSAATAIDVPPPSVARVVAHADAGAAPAVAGDRRRRGRAGARGRGRPIVVSTDAPATDPDALGELPVENPVDVPWWFDGVLHLAHGTVRVADVSQLVETGVGVVYADSDGRGHRGRRRRHAARARHDGPRDAAGGPDPVSAGSPGPSPRAGTSSSTTRSPTARSAASTRATDTRLIGWDRERLYYHSEGSDWAVAVSVGCAHRPRPGRASRGRVRLGAPRRLVGAELRDDGGLTVGVQPLFNIVRGGARHRRPALARRQLRAHPRRRRRAGPVRRPRPATGTATGSTPGVDPRRRRLHRRGPRRLGRRQPRRHLRPLRVPGLQATTSTP